jgi:hypothetical protein
LINGFQPSVGDSFSILTCNARKGTFANLTALDLGNSKKFIVAYLANGVTLTVGPSQ